MLNFFVRMHDHLKPFLYNFECSIEQVNRGHIFSCVWPFYEWAVSDMDRSMHRSLLVLVAHNLFVEGSHIPKNTASEQL
jgi:hypothetical protein